MKHFVTVWAYLLCCAAVASADPIPLDSDEAIRALGDAAMKSLVEKGPASIFEVFAPHWKANPERVESYRAQTRTQRKEKEADYGKTLGYDFVSKKSLGNSLTGLLYIEKTERYPVLWFLSFYKPADKWFFHSYYWNTEFEAPMFSQTK